MTEADRQSGDPSAAQGARDLLSDLFHQGELEELTFTTLGLIDGQEIERRLIEIASIGGTALEPTLEQPKRYATNRPALTKADYEGRMAIINMMEIAGLEIDNRHPLAVFGRLRGSDPERNAVMTLSHTDTVPNSDMYDGVLGVVGPIIAVEAMQEAGFKPSADIIIASLTGEESSRFNIALFGSKAIFHGLEDKDLGSRKDTDQSIREALGPGVDITTQPFIGPKGNAIAAPGFVIETHVEQGDILARMGIDIGVVESIATPHRYEVGIGNSPLTLDNTTYPYMKYFKLTVDGKADHSGTTPMGSQNRADGLVELANTLLPIIDSGIPALLVAIGKIEVEAEAINKVPGVTKAELRVGGNSEEELQELTEALENQIFTRNSQHRQHQTRFDDSPIALEEVDQGGQFFEPEAMRRRQKSALELVVAVNQEAENLANKNVVGTVGTFSTSAEGKLTLRLDIRGIDAPTRGQAIKEIKCRTKKLGTAAEINFGELLPGSGDPVELDDDLALKALDVIDQFEVGSAVSMFSAAGHDAQNAARAGLPTIMLFSPSRNNGLAHHPDAYSTPQDLEKVTRAAAALIIRLAA